MKTEIKEEVFLQLGMLCHVAPHRFTKPLSSCGSYRSWEVSPVYAGPYHIGWNMDIGAYREDAKIHLSRFYGMVTTYREMAGAFFACGLTQEASLCMILAEKEVDYE